MRLLEREYDLLSTLLLSHLLRKAKRKDRVRYIEFHW